MERHGFLKKITAILTVFCFIVTALVCLFYFTCSAEINRMLEVGFLIKTQYLHDVTVKQLLKGAARGMVESLDDPYSVFMDAQEYNDLQRYIQGSFGGIGIYVEVTKDRKLVVSSPIEGTPAYKAGIKRGDIIIKVDDAFTSEMEYDEAIARMRGEPGTKVKISVMREGMTKLLDFTLTREIIDIPSVESRVLENNIGYLRLKVFSSNTDEIAAKHLKSLQEKGIKALILDLRDNPGGDLETAVNIADYLIPESPIVYIVNKSGYTQTYKSADRNYLHLPLVVLINGGSASASEVLSGAVKDTGAGVLMGEKTFGKGIVQGIFPLGKGEGLKLTTSKYLTPAKKDIHEKGIEPDIVVAQPAAASEDVQLKKALEYLKSRLK
ncbi:MAG: S41 family peptidase [Peptococcaceae bacterium]|nr:S41 family peptidase [Peptococcaceae bacterium]MDH7524764.1 S41 family peptidase [Peptococcaceae bacterium]